MPLELLICRGEQCQECCGSSHAFLGQMLSVTSPFQSDELRGIQICRQLNEA